MFYKQQNEVSSQAYEEIRLNIIGMSREIKNSSSALTEALELVVKEQLAVEEAVKMANKRILELKQQREEKKVDSGKEV